VTPAVPKVSPAFQALLEKGLFDRLPVTFSTYCYDQIKDWDLLFPAEKSYFERLFGLLDRSEPRSVDELFQPLREAERKMGVNGRVWPKRQFTLEQVDFLNRSPHYAEWRRAVAGVFSRLDPMLDAEVMRRGNARLVVVVSPPELPVAPDRLWLRLRDRGKRIRLEGGDEEEWPPLLARLLARYGQSPKRAPYGGWLIETSESGSAAAGQASGAVRLSYQRLLGYRSRLMAEVRKIVEAEQIRGPRELGARLKQLTVHASEADVAGDPVLAEFLRAVLLSGNGTLLINNTFVEWAAIQAIRRARPSLLVLGFGIRNKIKPFTSLLIYEDQRTSTPIPDQMDALGSYVDLEVFYQYIWQECEKYAEYQRNTAYLFVAEGMDEMLVIAPPDFPLLASGPVRTAQDALERAAEWLGW
jgi:hypothetical protein